MSEVLARLARTLSFHWKRSLAVAIGIVILLGIAAGTSSPGADDFTIPGTETQQALNLFEDHMPALAGSDSTVVFMAKSGSITDPDQRQAVRGALDEIGTLDGVASVADPYVAGGMISPDEKIAAVDVRYDIEPGDLDPEHGEMLLEAAQAAEESADMSVAARGMLIDVSSQQEAPIGELIGIVIAIILLTLLFRSKAAMAATLVGALLGVMLGQILITALSSPLGLPQFAGVIAVMLGLGAGIDYSLLIIGRYREQVEAGDSVRDAAAKAAATSGASVVAAGLIVMVAIAGLLVVGIPMIGKMGIGAAIGIAAVVISAITILPIMIGALARWLRPKKFEHTTASKSFTRWGEKVTERPWMAIAAGVLVLVIFAIPVTSMRLGQPDDGNQPESKTQRVAYDALSEAFGPGYNGPFLVAVDTSDGGASGNQQILKELEREIGQAEGVASISPPGPSPDDQMAMIAAVPTTAPQDAATSDLLDRLRNNVIPDVTDDSPVEAYIGGNTAGFEDFSSKVAERLPLFIAVVIGLSVLLLIMAFRSLWIPLVSALFNLLSVGAAYGIVTAVFQEGIGASLIGVDSGVPVVSFIPVMLFAILFGLSMDYNVFLLSRVREAYKEGAEARESVILGLGRIGKVVLFAGLIMASVFLAFVSQPDVIAKMMGLGLGAAILIDVIFVRLVIAPAVVTLLGDKAWWMPQWMDKIMPNVSLEGHLVSGVDMNSKQSVGEDADSEAEHAADGPEQKDSDQPVA